SQGVCCKEQDYPAQCSTPPRRASAGVAKDARAAQTRAPLCGAADDEARRRGRAAATACPPRCPETAEPQARAEDKRERRPQSIGMSSTCTAAPRGASSRSTQ